MDNLPTTDRRYDEKEVSRLLRRASELQRESGAGSAAGGLTLRELEEIATEAGIDAASLRRAADELDERRKEGGGAARVFAGGPLRILLERTLPFEAAIAALDGLVPMIEMGADVPGEASRAGGNLTWRSDDNRTPRRVRVAVSVRAGSTVVRIEESFGIMTGVLYALVGGPVAGVGFGIGAGLYHAFLLPALVAAVPLAGTALVAVAIRSGLRRSIRRRRGLLERLLEDICQSLAGSASERQLNA